MQARESLGWIYETTGRYREAIDEYRALLERNPGDNQGVRYLIAPLYLLDGDAEGSEVEWDRLHSERQAIVEHPPGRELLAQVFEGSVRRLRL
ncbi:MAG: tetratricopeptide repeat protein [Candidatus Bipolaricaulia bacterium]